MPLLRVENLVKEYRRGYGRGSARGFAAVDHVDLEIEPGEIVGLVGESGSGKSTLGRCILRLIEPTSGTILFDGRDLLQMRGEQLRRLRAAFQPVFQDPFSSLNPRMRVGEALREPLRVHSIVPGADQAAEALRLLRSIGLGDEYAQRYPHALSGGQRQRVGIARALATRPKLIVADEPVSALDASTRADILRLFQIAQRESGVAVLFITHDLLSARRICRRIAVMSAGKIVEIGAAEEIFENPQLPYTQALLRAVPRIGAPLVEAAQPNGASH